LIQLNVYVETDRDIDVALCRCLGRMEAAEGELDRTATACRGLARGRHPAQTRTKYGELAAPRPGARGN
jgi:hypothetical protein